MYVLVVLLSVSVIGFGAGFGASWLLEKIENAMGSEQ